ncbi:MAG: hypothetical protein ABW145_01480, partial [Candidatus Thiodiazotropha sp.]
MKRLYLATRLKVLVAVFVILNLLTILSVLLLGGYQHWLWVFPLLSIATAVLVGHRMKMPFYVMQEIERALQEMLQGQFTSRITRVPWMGEAGHIAWNLNESLDQLETFFR